jgi:hypothetical protein
VFALDFPRLLSKISEEEPSMLKRGFVVLLGFLLAVGFRTKGSDQWGMGRLFQMRQGGHFLTEPLRGVQSSASCPSDLMASTDSRSETKMAKHKKETNRVMAAEVAG